MIKLRIAKARSIEDGGSYHFLITHVDLGKTKQGHELPGMFVSPISQGEGPTQDDHLEVQKLGQMRQIVTQLGDATGTVDLEDLVVEWLEQGLIKGKQSRGNTVAPPSTSAAVQEAFHKIAPDIGGTIYGDYLIRAVTKDKNVILFKVGKAQF